MLNIFRCLNSEKIVSVMYTFFFVPILNPIIQHHYSNAKDSLLGKVLKLWPKLQNPIAPNHEYSFLCVCAYKKTSKDP